MGVDDVAHHDRPTRPAASRFGRENGSKMLARCSSRMRCRVGHGQANGNLPSWKVRTRTLRLFSQGLRRVGHKLVTTCIT